MRGWQLSNPTAVIRFPVWIKERRCNNLTRLDPSLRQNEAGLVNARRRRKLEATKENPSPLDGYESAKSDEPIFVLQGGDPLAAPLVRIWAYLARVRTGLRGDASMIEAPIFAAMSTSIEHDPKECKNLLMRATEAEQVSWHMDGYRRGEVMVTHETSQRVDELERIELSDMRRRCASLLSNAFSELNDYRLEFTKRNFLTEEDIDVFFATIQALRNLHSRVEIRRGN